MVSLQLRKFSPNFDQFFFKMNTENLIPDDDFRDMFVEFGILCLAVVAFIVMLCAFPFALDALR